MDVRGWIQMGLFLALLIGLAIPLGRSFATGLEGDAKLLRPLERFLYRLGGVDPDHGMTGRQYGFALIAFNAVGFGFVFLLQRLQGVLPLNPDGLGAVEPGSAINTAASFATNTNWQGYGGESTMSHLTQMLGLGVQNFLSAATGIAVLAALARAFRTRESGTIGNFWADMVRSTVHVLIPIALVFAVFLVARGVPMTFSSSAVATTVEGAQQKIALGPVASQESIKMLGTNGGGFFNVNSAHPFENPDPLTNFLELLSILIIPAALCVTFGAIVKDRRQGFALLAVMTLLFVLFLVPAYIAEGAGNPALMQLGLATSANMEGKEVRFGVANSVLWSVATTAASNGSVNSMHDSFTPLGGMMPMILMQLGEVVFGGVGSGLYGLILFAVVAVFVAGLMVGRTPEYMGKKIEAYEMKMASIGILIPCALVLVASAIAISFGAAKTSMANPGPHGFSELLYAYSSMANNNGSAFAGFSANVPFHNWLGAAVMWIARFGVMLPVVGIAASLARKKIVPASAGTLPTHTGLFIGLLCGTVLLVGALTFIPALALGPIVEALGGGAAK